MPLYDAASCPHTADVYSVAYTADAGGGSQAVYTLAQSGVPCFAPTVGSNTQERFGREQIVTEHKISFAAGVLTSALQPGWKLVVNGATLHITGIMANQAVGTIPALVEATCESLG